MRAEIEWMVRAKRESRLKAAQSKCCRRLILLDMMVAANTWWIPPLEIADVMSVQDGTPYLQ